MQRGPALYANSPLETQNKSSGVSTNKRPKGKKKKKSRACASRTPRITCLHSPAFLSRSHARGGPGRRSHTICHKFSRRLRARVFAYHTRLFNRLTPLVYIDKYIYRYSHVVWLLPTCCRLPFFARGFFVPISPHLSFLLAFSASRFLTHDTARCMQAQALTSLNKRTHVHVYASV